MNSINLKKWKVGGSWGRLFFGDDQDHDPKSQKFILCFDTHIIRHDNQDICSSSATLSRDSHYPTGVFTLLADCYSPTCSRMYSCYSVTCPRRYEDKLGGGNQSNAPVKIEKPAELWSTSVPPELLASGPPLLSSQSPRRK